MIGSCERRRGCQEFPCNWRSNRVLRRTSLELSFRSGTAADEEYAAQNAATKSVGLTTVSVVSNVKQAAAPPGTGMIDVVIAETFGGQKAGLNSVLARYTWYGDMDLNTLINADDYIQIDTGYLAMLCGAHAKPAAMRAKASPSSTRLVSTAGKITRLVVKRAGVKCRHRRQSDCRSSSQAMGNQLKGRSRI